MGLIARIVIVGRCLENEGVEQVARQDRKKKRTADGRQEGCGDARGGRGFLLGPIKKPVSSSVSKSLLWHSRQLRKHLKAPEKPDNTSLVECRVPLGGRRDFAPCQQDTPPFSVCCNIGSILCIKHRVPSPRARREMLESKKFLLRFLASVVNRSPAIMSSYLAKRFPRGAKRRVIESVNLHFAR